MLQTEPLCPWGHWGLRTFSPPPPRPGCSPYTHSPKAASTRAKQERNQRKAMLLRVGMCSASVRAPFMSPGAPHPPGPAQSEKLEGQPPCFPGTLVISGGQAHLAARLAVSLEHIRPWERGSCPAQCHPLDLATPGTPRALQARPASHHGSKNSCKEAHLVVAGRPPVP